MKITNIKTYLITSEKSVLFIVLSLIALAGFIYSLVLGEQLRFQDEGHYLRMANNLIKHKIYSYDINAIYPTAFHPPGYTIIIASVIALGGGILTLRMLNFLSLCLCIFIIFHILKKHDFSFGARWLPVIIFCYPVLFFTASTIYPQIIAATIFVFIIYIADNSAPKSLNAIFTGGLYGMLILISPSFIMVLPVMIITHYILKGRFSFKYIMAFILGIAIILTPWAIRNYIVFHRFVLLSNNAGKTFILGNSENARPNTGEGIDLSKYDNEIKRLDLDEVDADRYYKKKAFEWIKNNPKDFIKLYLLKFFNYFNYRNELATKIEQSKLRDIVMFFTYYPILLLAMLRALFIKRYPLKNIEILFIIFYIMSAFSNALFLPRIRYRLPFDILLICLSAATLDYIKSYLKNIAKPTTN